MAQANPEAVRRFSKWPCCWAIAYAASVGRYRHAEFAQPRECTLLASLSVGKIQGFEIGFRPWMLIRLVAGVGRDVGGIWSGWRARNLVGEQGRRTVMRLAANN